NSRQSNAPGAKSFSVRIAVGASGWQWTFSATKFFTPQADSVGLAASDIRIHRSCGGNDRHHFHAAHDGFAGTAEGIHRLLDTGVRSNGIGGCTGRNFDDLNLLRSRSSALPLRNW